MTKGQQKEGRTIRKQQGRMVNFRTMVGAVFCAVGGWGGVSCNSEEARLKCVCACVCAMFTYL